MFHWDAENVNVMNGIKMLKMFVMNGNNKDVENLKILSIRSQVKN